MTQTQSQDTQTQDTRPQGTQRISSQAVDASDEVVDWSDLAARMWSFLTGREAAIHYHFGDMAIEVPRDTGADAPRATWKVDGTLTVTTSERGLPASPGRG